MFWEKFKQKLIPLWNENLLLNCESLSRISVCHRFPASFSQDLEDPCLTREPDPFVSFYY